MANVIGTIMCCYCSHATWGTKYFCNHYSVALPAEKHGAKNLLCAEFTPGAECESIAAMQAQYDELTPYMRKGYFYAFPYPSQDRAQDLKEVMELIVA